MLKPIAKLNGDDIEYTQKAIHLGTVIGSGADQANIKKAISDLHVSTNILASTFSHCSSDVLCSLFKTNCTSFYGSPLWNLDQTHIIQLHISWRKCIRKLFGLHPRTRSKYIPSLVRCSDLPVQRLSRFANFWYKCSFNANTIVSICAKLSLTSSSIAACNLKLLAAYLSCDAYSLCMLGASLSSFVQDQWKRSVSDGEAALASAVAELRDVVRGHSSSILSIAEARRLLLEQKTYPCCIKERPLIAAKDISLLHQKTSPHCIKRHILVASKNVPSLQQKTYPCCIKGRPLIAAKDISLLHQKTSPHCIKRHILVA
ncbi:hypothetical protein CAPTEDRAFT_193117 [Capitella teleta]|uniref:Uncharacterized protein n=1 Tax=Capitella teleta TaxID=283909 RepID=R7UNR4_CAPTE|nr:hypothetical protein CAPTEDRAFT_193117 [Capitella teleta]|eukprot:ELU07748.1 hypothetical protein CAPTEDRAFT_193117 [Capitella teleta]